MCELLAGAIGGSWEILDGVGWKDEFEVERKARRQKVRSETRGTRKTTSTMTTMTENV